MTIKYKELSLPAKTYFYKRIPEMWDVRHLIFRPRIFVEITLAKYRVGKGRNNKMPKGFHVILTCYQPNYIFLQCEQVQLFLHRPN